MTLNEIRQTAFAQWLKTQDRQAAAAYLFECASEGKPDSLIWDLLEMTGDRKYTEETFYRAVDLIQEVHQ